VDLRERGKLNDALARLGAGDRSAFAEVYAAIWPLVRSFAGKAVVERADADDVAQTALLKIFARASEFDPGRDAVAWVLGVVAWEVKTLRQRVRRRREEPAELATEPRTELTPEDVLIDRDLEAAALIVLGTLREADIATLEAVRNGERPDVAPATFRKRLERALCRFRTAWRSKHGT
jgi:RNA polymerase sigma factor (sigma-70 family)